MYRRLRIIFALGAAFSGVASQAAVIDEIVVTVQKREQTLQDVPVAVSAFDESLLRSLNAQDFRDVVRLTPGFNGATADSFNDALAIRGISSNSFGVGGDGSVPIFVDGVYEGRAGGATTTFLDVARTEIVRGPQNTLFGRNAIAGAIGITSNRPDPQGIAGRFGLGLEEFSHVDVSATINLPITDQWAFRGSAGFLTEDGYLSNLGGTRDLGDQENAAVQAAIAYSGDTLDAVFTAFYESREGDGSAYHSVAPLNANGELDFTDQTSRLQSDVVATDTLGRDDADILRLSLNLNVELAGGYSLTSITGYKTYEFNYLEDYDGTAALIDNFSVDQDVDYFSQELRLLSSSDGEVTWFLGASVYSEEVDADFADRYTEDDLCRALQITEDEDFDQSLRVSGCDDPIFEDYWEEDIDPADLVTNKAEATLVDAENWGLGIYGDLTWALSDRLDLSIGARYTFDEKEYSVCVPDSGGALGNNFIYDFFLTAESLADCGRAFDGTAPGGSITDKADWSSFTPRIAVNFDASDELTVYGNIAFGYKSGGFGDFGFTSANGGDAEAEEDSGLALPGTKPDQFDEEKVLSYELGLRSRLFDKSLQANLSIYAYDYEDLQLTFFSGGAQRTGTVDEASGYGIELDLRWLPGENWNIFFSAAYSDSEIDKVQGRFIDLGICNACQGNELPFAPEWTTAAVVTYSVPLADSAELLLTGEHSFYDEVYGGLDNLAAAKTDSWNEFNFRVGYDSGQQWIATLYVLNAFDEEYFERGWENADADNLFGYGIVNTQVWPSKPRTFGARLDYNF